MAVDYTLADAAAETRVSLKFRDYQGKFRSEPVYVAGADLNARLANAKLIASATMLVCSGQIWDLTLTHHVPFIDPDDGVTALAVVSAPHVNSRPAGSDKDNYAKVWMNLTGGGRGEFVVPMHDSALAQIDTNDLNLANANLVALATLFTVTGGVGLLRDSSTKEITTAVDGGLLAAKSGNSKDRPVIS